MTAGWTPIKPFWSSGYDAALSRLRREFDSHRGQYQELPVQRDAAGSKVLEPLPWLNLAAWSPLVLVR